MENLPRPAPAPVRPGLAALFVGDDGACWRLTLSAGCEIFVGRFARLDAFAGRDRIIRFHPIQRLS